MSMSVGGLVSGLDTTTLVRQLVQAEAAPQAALKTRLSIAQAGAVAYRSINTRFDALRTAAEAVLKPETWTAALLRPVNSAERVGAQIAVVWKLV